MKDHYLQYQNDVSNTANQLITQLVCAEKGLDYNHVLQVAQQAHINGILQQEQVNQFNQVLHRHYGGGSSTFVGKLKEVFGGGGSTSFLPMGVGMPQMPMSPMPAMMPPVSPVSAQLLPAQAASVISQQLNPSLSTADTDQLKKDVEDLKNILANVMNMVQATQHYSVPTDPTTL